MTDTVEAVTKVAFEKWRSPNFACIAQDPSLAQRQESQAMKVDKLSAEALAGLAQAWLDDLYAKTDHKNPFHIAR